MSAPNGSQRPPLIVDGEEVPLALSASLDGLLGAARKADGPSLIRPTFVGDTGGTLLVLDRAKIRLPAGVAVAVGGAKGQQYALVVDPPTGRTWLLVSTAQTIRELAPISAELARGLQAQLFGR